MIAELGHYSLILALMMATLGATVPHIGARVMEPRLMRIGDQAAIAQFLLVLISFCALTYSYIISDFSVLNVATNSHTLKPLIYKISGVWGNHEGSLLLWVLALTLFSAAVSVMGRKLPLKFRSRVLAIQSLLGVGFLLFILITSNPFTRIDPAPFDGNGLNPLLQDPGLIIHPPMLYLGYVGLSVAFSFAIAALIEGEVTPAWAKWVRPWTLAAWIFLTAGMALGSWWAYYELGWGGWWFWDPTENAVLMPWITTTALLHSAIVLEKRNALKSWTILLAIIAFSFSLLGTFLVRSGIVNSVHSFASDPERGVFILAFLAVVIGGSLAMYAWRAPRLKAGGLFGLVSRESALVLNNILLSTFAAVVLIGTLYPIILEAYDGTQITVGPPFFDFATTIIMSPLIVALSIGPILSWKRGKLSRAMQITLPAFIVGLVVALWVVWSNVGDIIMTAFGLGLAIWLILASLLEVMNRTQRFKLSRVRAMPRASWGMMLAHTGLGVVLIGITVSGAWSDEQLVSMKAGDVTKLGDYEMQFDGTRAVAGPNYTAVRGSFTVTKNAEFIATLEPEDRIYTDPIMNTTEAAIYPMVSGDLYAVIGQAVSGGRYAIRLYFKPLISGLWLGAIMMIIGGLLSLTDRRLRIGAPVRPPARVKENKRVDT